MLEATPLSEKNPHLAKAAERRQKLVDADVKRQVEKAHQAKADDIHVDSRGNVHIGVPPVEINIKANY